MEIAANCSGIGSLGAVKLKEAAAFTAIDTAGCNELCLHTEEIAKGIQLCVRNAGGRQ